VEPGSGPHVMELDWTEPLREVLVGARYDIIIGADVAYDDDCFGPLLDTIRGLTHTSPGAVVSWPLSFSLISHTISVTEPHIIAPLGSLCPGHPERHESGPPVFGCGFAMQRHLQCSRSAVRVCSL
jgi:hypothetical protein